MGVNGTTSSGPWTNYTTQNEQIFEKYMRVELASAVILIFLSPITVAANSLLLSAIYKDPLRCFRTPTTYFIAGLALSDLFTGLLVEPFFATYYIAHYSQCGSDRSCITANTFQVLYRTGGIISTIAISSSFIVVLALSISQYIAVTFPHKYKKMVTKSRVVWSVGLSWAYFIGFSLLQFSGIDLHTYLKIDLILHATVISVFLAVVHSLLYFSFRRHLSRSYTWRRKNVYEKTNNKEAAETQRSRSKTDRRRLSERQFTIVTFYLAGILLFSASTHSIVLYVYFFYKNRSFTTDVDLHIFLRISDMLLFLKVALDPFIYAWRLPTYRKALKHTLVSQTRPCGPALPKEHDGLTFFLQESRKKIESAAG